MASPVARSAVTSGTLSVARISGSESTLAVRTEMRWALSDQLTKWQVPEPMLHAGMSSR